jgi:hypothetical protein
VPYRVIVLDPMTRSKLGENKSDIQEFSPHKQSVNVIRDVFQIYARFGENGLTVHHKNFSCGGSKVWTSMHLFYKMGCEVM